MTMSDDFEKTKAAAIRTAQAVLARRHNLPLYHGEIHEPMQGYVNKRLRRFRTRQVSTIEKFVCTVYLWWEIKIKPHLENR